MKQECGLGRDDAVRPYTYTISTYCYIQVVRDKLAYEKFPEWVYIQNCNNKYIFMRVIVFLFAYCSSQRGCHVSGVRHLSISRDLCPTFRSFVRPLEDAGASVRRPLSPPATLVLKTFKLLSIGSIASVKTYYMICLLMKYAQLTYYQIIYSTLARKNTTNKWRHFALASFVMILIVQASSLYRLYWQLT